MGTQGGGTTDLRLHMMWRAPRRHLWINSQAVIASSTRSSSRTDRNGIVAWPAVATTSALCYYMRACVHAHAEAVRWEI
jgi:hypothetical protein